MNTIQNSFFRALGAIVVGVLLIQYREDTVKWITILAGVIFFLSGVFSLITYYASMRQSTMNAPHADGSPTSTPRPPFPIAGLGSVVLGAVLALMPTTFVTWITHIFAFFIILGAINQLLVLVQMQRMAHVGWFYWLTPSVLLLIGIVAIIYPQAIASAPLLVIGWCLLVYGVAESMNALKTWMVRRALNRAQRQQQPKEAEAEEGAEEETE